ncbi:MAG: hypothetical protein JWN22_91 [Nocardioides sp.]|nr:hypothetical protein [Nocardioides sp.]
MVIRASSRPAKAVKLVAMEAWPFFHEKEGFEGSLRLRGVFDPIYELWAVAANDAADTRAAGRPWDLSSAAPHLSAADNDRVTEVLGDVATKIGRFVPRRRKKA